MKHLGKCFSIRCRIPAATVAFKAMPAVLLKCPIHPGTPETNPPGRRGMHSRMNSKAARTPIIRPSPRFSCSFRFGMACLAFCMSWKRAAFLPWCLGMRLLQWPNQQSRKKRKEKTTLFGINSMRSQVLYRTGQGAVKTQANDGCYHKALAQVCYQLVDFIKMRTTDCFGKTRLALHVPGSS